MTTTNADGRTGKNGSRRLVNVPNALNQTSGVLIVEGAMIQTRRSNVSQLNWDFMLILK